jgi:tripartite-type tricarboxylate transporter receptor subunit TctC
MPHSVSAPSRVRRTLLTSLALATLGGVSSSLQAQSSSTPVRLIVGFPPGGSTDAVARQLAEAMRARLDRPVLVENKSGAAGRLGPEFVKSAAADGTVILVTPNPMITQYPSVYKKLSYDPGRDLMPLAQIASYPLLVSVGPAVPESVQTLRDYLQWAKASPKNAFFASPAAGSTPHFVGIMLGQASGLTLNHVAYRGDAPAVQDLLGGQVPMSINVPAAQLPHVGSGRLRVLATTGAKRMPDLPNVPTLAEQGFESLRTSDWFGMFLPAATPPAVAQRLQAVVREALTEPALRANFAKLGIEPAFIEAGEFARRIREETTAFAQTVKAVGFTPED